MLSWNYFYQHGILSKPLSAFAFNLVKTKEGGERKITSVAMGIIDHWKEYYLSWGLTLYHKMPTLTLADKKAFENIVEQERQIVARYARLTPSCKAVACTGQNSSMKKNKGH